MPEAKTPWRVEVAPNNRRLCITQQCPHPDRKIRKGDLILGERIWWRAATGADAQGSLQRPCYYIPPGYRYRHWGCVSGDTVQRAKRSMREPIFGGLDWSQMGGVLDGTLDPITKKKVFRVILEGHIDPEDFNGDPEYNTPDSLTICVPGIVKWEDVKKVDEVGDKANQEAEGRGWRRQRDSDAIDKVKQPPKKKVKA